MLEEKKARGSRDKQGSLDPKTSRISSGAFNSTARKTSNISNSNNAIDPARRFALLSERCAPSPAPGPITAPLFGGLPGSSLLIGQQAVSLRLTQLKAQIALTQINNALAVGSRAATLTANSNTPAPYIPTKPPSPTAAAINLLNLLKIANTMSHPFYNPYASGNQSSTQGQYGLSNIPAERDPRGSSSHLGPGSGFGTGTSSVTPASSGGMFPTLPPQPMNYRPEQSRAMIDENMERSTEMNMSRAREEARLLGKPMHQPIDQGPLFTCNQRDEFLSSGTRMPPYPMSSASDSLGHRHSGMASSSASLDWSSNYKRPTADEPSKCYSSPASSSYASAGDSRFNASRERQHDMQSIPGLGDFEEPAPPTKSIQPMYTSELASDILKNFGLEKEDLEHLISFPEDQITPANLPFILRQIRSDKTKRETTAAQSKSCPEPQPARSVSGMDSRSLSIGGAAIRQEELSTSVLRPSKVIDYGHTGKYTGGVEDEIGRTGSSRGSGSGGMLLMDTYDSSRHSREQLQQSKTEMKSSALGSSQEQGTSVPSLSSSYSSILSSVTPSSNDKTKGLQAQPTQTPPATASSFSLPKEDTDLRILKSEAPKHTPLKKPAEDCQSSFKTQPPSHLFRGVHPSRPGLVVIGSNDTSRTKDQSKTQEQGSKGAVQMKKQQTQQQAKQQNQPMQQNKPMQQQQNQPKQQQQKQPMQQQQSQPKQPMQQKQQTKTPPVTPTGSAMWPPAFSAEKPVPPTSHIPTITERMHRPAFIPGGPSPMVIPPAQPLPIPNDMGVIPPTPPPPDKHPLAKMPPSKALPTEAMMQDYAASTPRVFPHTCTLCNRKCGHMKTWLSHQNTNLHLESCKLLRKQYPDWDGEIAHKPRAKGKDPKPSSSTSKKTSKHRHKKARRESSSSSRSPSPHRRHGSRGRREKWRSRSRSPYSSRYTRRSRSRSHSPWYERPSSSQYPSRSWSPDSRSLPGWRDDRRLSPRRSREGRSPPCGYDPRQLPPWRSDPRQSPPWRGDPRQSPPWRSDPRRSPPRRSDPRPSPPRRSDGPSQRKKSNTAQSLAKKLLEAPEIQSLSSQPNLEAVIKTLTPVLVQLVKMKSSSPSSAASSSSSASKKKVAKKPSKAKSSQQTSNVIVISEGEEEGKEANTDSKEQKNLPRKVLLPTPNMPRVPPLLPEFSHFVRGLLSQKSATRGSVKGPTTATKSKVLVSKAKNVSAKEISKKTGKLSEKQALTKDMAKKKTPLGSKSMAPGKRPGVKNSKPKESESKVQEVVPKDTTKAVEKRNVTVVETKPQAELGKANDAKDAEPMETGDIGVEVSEPMELRGSTESQEQKTTTTEAVPTNTAKKSTESQPLNSTIENLPTETSVKALTHVQQSSLSELESAAQGAETKTEASHMQQQAAESQSEDVLEAKQPGGELKNEMIQKDPLDAMNTEMDAASPNSTVETPPTETSVQALPHLQQIASSGTESIATDDVVETKKLGGEVETKTITNNPVNAVKTTNAASANNTPKGVAVTRLAKAEMLKKDVLLSKIKHFRSNTSLPPLSVLERKRQLLISNLPDCNENRYTEGDLARLLRPFGFQYKEDSIHGIPQARMAIVSMPKGNYTFQMMQGCVRRDFPFKRSIVSINVLRTYNNMQPLEFYRTLMKMVGHNVFQNGLTTVLIKNISWSMIPELRKTLDKIGTVKDFVPLLNKVFVEFESTIDADRFGVYCSLLRRPPAYEVHRLKIPTKKSGRCGNILPNSKDAALGITPPKFTIPPGSTAPFWVTMNAHPFLFPCSAPWFVIPEYLTISRMDDIEKASGHGSMIPTIMLTGLPSLGGYKHEDVAELVWRYFPKQNLHSLYYNVVVLTLQRRAFVFFADWTTCCNFVRNHIKSPVSVKGCKLSVHFVLDQMHPDTSEETMYTSLMKLNNTVVPDPESLEDRLLCVEIAMAFQDVIKAVANAVAAIATFVSFLTLSNRICFEMARASDVTKVLESYRLHPWKPKFQPFSVKSLKQRLQDSSEITINFEQNTISVKAKPQTVKSQTQPPPARLLGDGSQHSQQTSGPGESAIPEPITAGPSATDTSDAVMKDPIIDSTDGPEANEDVEKAEVKAAEGSLTTSIPNTDVTSTSAISCESKVPAPTSAAPSATISVTAKPAAVTSQTQPPPSELLGDGSQPSLQTSGPGESTIPEPITAGPNATATSDEVMDEDEKPGTEATMDSTDGPEANEDVEKAEVKAEEGSLTTSISSADVTSTTAVSSENKVPAPTCPAPSATARMPEEKPAQLPHMNTDNFPALLEAVRKHRLARESMFQREQERSHCESNSISRAAAADNKPQGQGEIDFTEDVELSDGGLLFDEPTLDMDDFVTVDEVGDDVGDRIPKRPSSPRSKEKRQSSSLSSTGKGTSTRYSKYSSKSTKGSSPFKSSSVSPKKSKYSSEPTKSSTKPLTSTSVWNTSSSSYSHKSTETSSSPGQKTHKSKINSPTKTLNTASSSRSTHFSSTAHETHKMATAVTVEASMETHSEQDKAKAKGSAVAKTDHKVSAEGITAKTVESETKIDSSSMHPPQQGHGLEMSQGQTHEMGFNEDTCKDQKESKGKMKEDDIDQHTELEKDEKYQILDSLDQIDEQINVDQHARSEAQLTGPEGGQTLHKEEFRVLDSVDDEISDSPHRGGSFQVLDSVTEVQVPTGQEDSHLVQNNSSTEKQLSVKDAVPSGTVGKDQEANNVNIQGSDVVTQAPSDLRDVKRRKEMEGNLLPAECCTASEDVENPDNRIPNKDPTPQNLDNKDTLKAPDSEVPEQETFEVLDSIDDQTETEDDRQNTETPSDQKSKENIQPMEEEEDAYQVIDSVEDQPTTEETESEPDKKGKRNIKEKDDRPSRRSGPTTRTSKSEEKDKSPKKQDRKYETRKKMDITAVSKKYKEVTEDMEYEIVDSVDEQVQDVATTEMSGRRRSARGKKEDKITLNLTEASEKPEEASYEILDSVEDETANDQPTTITTRSTRGRRARTEKDASHEKTKEVDTPTRTTRRRNTPAQESQEHNRVKTPNKEEKAPPKERTPSRRMDNVGRESIEEDATYDVVDTLEDEGIKNNRPATRRKGQRGRQKKGVKTTKIQSGTLKESKNDASEIVSDEETETYQIIDSVEDEMVGEEKNPKNKDQQTEKSSSLTKPTKKDEEEEEEPMYQILDSLEDDQAQEELTAMPDKAKDETPLKEEATVEKEGMQTLGTTPLEASEKVLVKEDTPCQRVKDLKELKDDLSAAEGSAVAIKEGTPKTETKKEDKSTTKSQCDTVIPVKDKNQQSPHKDDRTSSLVNLDEVSEEEEDYPDDAEEVEEQTKRQAAAKEKQLAKEQDARRTREREDRERRSRSRSSSRGRGGGVVTRRAKDRGREEEETVEVDTKELVTLDEVGADEAEEERTLTSRDWDGDFAEGELSALVTLDEFIEEEEEDGEAEHCRAEVHPPRQEDELVDFLNPETLVTLDEAGDDEEKPEEEQTEKTSTSAKRKHDDDTEESMNFVTVDEVGEVEEEEEKEPVKTRTRGQARKRTRQTPVRKSTRGKSVAAKDERDEEERELDSDDVLPPTPLDASSSLDKDLSTLSSDSQPEVQKTEAEAGTASQADLDAASAELEPPPEHPENQTLEDCMEGGEEEKEGWNRADKKALSKQRRDPAGLEAKRSRSQSPCVDANVKLPAFKPNNPLGQEFVVPTSGYFCKLCSVFYLNESSAREVHCSSQRHFDNLQKHYQNLQQKPSRSSTQSS